MEIPALHLEGVGMDIGDIDVAWSATRQFTGVRSAAMRHLITAAAGEREGGSARGDSVDLCAAVTD
jgi:hypothetical protein